MFKNISIISARRGTFHLTLWRGKYQGVYLVIGKNYYETRDVDRVTEWAVKIQHIHFFSWVENPPENGW